VVKGSVAVKDEIGARPVMDASVRGGIRVRYRDGRGEQGLSLSCRPGESRAVGLPILSRMKDVCRGGDRVEGDIVL